MNTKWIHIILSIVAVVIAAIVIGVNVQAKASPAADQPGPYKVGFVTNTYSDLTRSDNAGGERPITTYIWYPAASDNGGNPWSPAVFDLGIPGLPPFSSTDFEAYGVDPAYQGAAASQDGPFPLVVLSHGGKAIPLFYVHIGARLASHGFVVAIPYNYGEGVLGEPTTWELDSPQYGIGTYIDRTRDIQYLMTRLGGRLAAVRQPADRHYPGGSDCRLRALLGRAGGTGVGRGRRPGL